MELKLSLSCPNKPCRFNDAERGRVTYTSSHQEELHSAPLLLIPVSMKGLDYVMEEGGSVLQCKECVKPKISDNINAHS